MSTETANVEPLIDVAKTDPDKAESIKSTEAPIRPKTGRKPVKKVERSSTWLQFDHWRGV